MKYLKKYEKLKSKQEQPQVGDYVLVYYNNFIASSHIELFNFINNNIGIVYRIEKYDDNDPDKVTHVNIIWNNIPKKLKMDFKNKNSKTASIKYVFAFGKTVEEVEMKALAKKYNI